ncbi:MAG: GNAT family N-acetyltransferase [Spirochaetales bacterium]|nr:GNAT family N-acetyltransferase [Spirochaetales bacterium]
MIRKVKLSDAEQLHELSNELGYLFDKKEFYKNLEELMKLNDHVILVKEIEENNVIGYVHGQIYRVLYFEKLLNILGLVVSRGYRNSGYGKALMHEVEYWAKSNGCKGVRLNSGNERDGAHKFYEIIGYTMRKQQKNFYKQF